MTGRVTESTVLNLEACGSTNKEAMRLALNGEPGPLWVRADRQDEGRGRSGRAWTSLRGNLHASLMVRYRGPLEHGAQLSLVAGVGVADAIATGFSGHKGNSEIDRLWLKWPNDIMIGPAKCGGILVETSTLAQGRELVVVIGVGLNLKAAPSMDERPTTCLGDHGFNVVPEEMLVQLDKALLKRLNQWDCGHGFSDIRSAWLARSGGIGSKISVHEGLNVLKGTFAGLNEAGHLILQLEDGKKRNVTWGDVIFS